MKRSVGFRPPFFVRVHAGVRRLPRHAVGNPAYQCPRRTPYQHGKMRQNASGWQDQWQTGAAAEGKFLRGRKQVEDVAALESLAGMRSSRALVYENHCGSARTRVRCTDSSDAARRAQHSNGAGKWSQDQFIPRAGDGQYPSQLRKPRVPCSRQHVTQSQAIGTFRSGA